jgi:hypothetical protein
MQATEIILRALRKVTKRWHGIRPKGDGESTELDVKNEVQALDSLARNGRHENIIDVIKHRWLNSAGKFYFIDMDLADLPLANYIDRVFRREPLSSHIGLIQNTFNPLFSRPYCTPI